MKHVFVMHRPDALEVSGVNRWNRSVLHPTEIIQRVEICRHGIHNLEGSTA